LFENPRRPDAARIDSVVGSPAHRSLNLEVARRSLVLLRNDGLLPLLGEALPDATGRARRDGAPRRVAVIGPLADDAQTQLGDWAGSSGQADWLPDGHPRDLITTVLDGVRRMSPDDWTVEYAEGADILTLEDDPAGPRFPDGQPRPPVVVPSPPDDALISDAVAAARRSDVAVVVVGDRIELVGEGRSTATLELIGGQNALIDAIADSGTPFVIVLLASKPLVLPPSAERASALLWAASPGMEGGRAIAEVLLGLVEPTGRLPISFPRHVGQQPTYYNQIRGQHGNRYADLTQRPAHAFGEGLSYTTVEYGDLRMLDREYGPDDTVRAQVRVTNTGARPTREVVQVYIRDDVTSASWAEKELKAYRLVDLAPGASRVVSVEVPVADCSIVGADGVRRVEPGRFELLVGASSRDEALLSASFTVIGG
jgi:beta-glucosidase